MLNAPIDHPLNLTMQTILTVASWAITLAFLVLAIRKGAQQRTPFFVVLVIAGGIGGLFEPLYDVGFKLLFYIPGQWTMFSAFGIPQPVWTVSGYVTLFSGPAMLIADRIPKGLTREQLLRWSGILVLTTSVFEITGINGGAYAYWGPHAFRILQYPLVVGVLEATMVTTLAVAAAFYRARMTSHWHLAGLVPLYLIVFYGINFGLGAPTLVAIAMDTPSPALVAAASLLSIVSAVATVWTLAASLPSAAFTSAETDRTLPGLLPRPAD